MSPIFDGDGPGWKGTDTSKEAASGVKLSAARYRTMTFNMLREHGPMTADEVAKALNLSVLTIRPRVSELRNAGRIADTGERRKNISGRNAAVWRAV